MIGTVTPQILEASNGALLGVGALMLCGLASYIWFEFRDLGFWGTYHNRKAAIALSVFLGGLWLRTFVIWYARHAANHGLPDPPWANYAIALLSIGTAAAIVGGVCWLRVTTWRELPRWFWLAAPAALIAAGILLAL